MADVLPVPHSYLRKKKTRAEEKEQRAASYKKHLEESAARKQEIQKRSEGYVNEYSASKKSVENERRDAEQKGNYYIPAEPKLAFVVRIRGLNNVSPKVRTALQLLRLRQIHNGVFVKLNPASLSMLRIVAPYVAWGYPSVESVRKLITQRGALKVGGKRKLIKNNNMVNQVLGRYDVICVEDLVNRIYNVGDNFKQINNHLWPFKLNSPRGGRRTAKKHWVDGGSFGNREHLINKTIRSMLHQKGAAF